MAMIEMRARIASKSSILHTLLFSNCEGMLMMTATKAVTQKRVAKVDVSRKITRKGSTKVQTTVGRTARERRWTKYVKVQRTKKRIANGHVLVRSLKDTASGASCAVAMMHCAIIMASRQTMSTSTCLIMVNGSRLLDDILPTKNLISNARIEALQATATMKAAQKNECHHHWFCSLSVFSTSHI